VSSAWVRGCVHFFAWAAHIPPQLAGMPGQSASAAGGKAAPALTAYKALAGAGLAAPISNDISSWLAGSAAAAGAQGGVDVQVGKQPPQQYQVQLGSPPAAALPAATSTSPSSDMPLEICSVTPPCLTLPDLFTSTAGAAGGSSAASALTLQLVSRQAQQVRVIILAAAAGEVLVDRSYQATAGGITNLPVEVPLDALAHAAKGTQRNNTSAELQPVIPLRLIVTAADHYAGQPQHRQPVCLHATATLLAAPALLASELCILAEAMQQQGRAEGLSDQEVWSTHWQQLINDLCMCLMAANDPSSGMGTTEVRGVASSLATFFSTHGMTGWEGQMQGVLQALGRQQVEGRQASEEQAGAGAIADAPAGPLPPPVTQDSKATPQAGTSTGEGDGSKAADDSSKCSSTREPPMKHFNLSFSDGAQEWRYRDWAMRRACVPIRVW
jgi:hypothetical protein